jgi:hypothetical protein
METYIKLLLWVLSGLVFGSFLYYVILQPGVPAYQNQTVSNVTAIQNGTPLPQNTSPPSNPAQKSDVGFILIRAPNCNDCTSGDMLANQSYIIFNETGKFTVTGMDTPDPSSTEAKALISKYNITRLPVLIIVGNTSAEPTLATSWQSSVGTVESDGTMVSRILPPPYYDSQTGQIVGLVQGIGIMPYGCKSCMNVSVYFQSLSGQSIGMAFSNVSLLDENSSRAQELINVYNITKLPTILLGPDAGLYSVFKNSIQASGTIENDGWFVLRKVVPPYVDTAANRSVRGYVDSIHLVNSSCTSCFNVSGLSTYIEDSAGLFVMDTKTYEINSTEGSALIKKYNITKIPTMLYSPEVSIYPGFAQAWTTQNNTIESDGWFVFRTVDAVGEGYQNVSAG